MPVVIRAPWSDVVADQYMNKKCTNQLAHLMASDHRLCYSFSERYRTKAKLAASKMSRF